MEESPLRVIKSQNSEARVPSRRQMIQRLFGATGTALALPGLSAAHPVASLLMSDSTVAAAEARAADPDWKPIFFDPHQNETLIVLAELIVPNSTQAQVNRFIDTLISVDKQENQKKFLAALGEFDHEAIARYDHPFKALSEEQQTAILAEASTAEASQPGQGVRRRRRPAVPKPGMAEPILTLRDHFDNIKGWVSGAFYSSEFGMKELGWTGQVAWESLPGCEHPAGHP
ncbi:MAG: gluconate 2-dehydrogenase subunit 3 family protein [Terriglobia bacterium]